MNDWHLFWAALGAGTIVLGALFSGQVYFVKTSISHEIERFENRFLKQLNDNFLSTKSAELLIKRGDEKFTAIQNDIENLYRIVSEGKGS